MASDNFTKQHVPSTSVVGTFGPRVRDGKLIRIKVPDSISGIKVDATLYPYTLISQGFYFHVIPETYSVQSSPNYNTQQIPGYGSVPQFGGPGLSSVTWDSMFVVRAWLTDDVSNTDDNITYYPTWILPPETGGGDQLFDAFDSIPLLEDIRDMGAVVELDIDDLQIRGGQHEFSKLVNITGFQWSEVAGEPDVRKYTITFTEWRPVKLRSVPSSGLLPDASSSRPSKKAPTSFTVPSDEYGIKRIAQEVWGKPNKWPEIIVANGGPKAFAKLKAAGKAEYILNNLNGPWFLMKGVKLKIPKLATPKKKPKSTKKQ